MREIAEWRLRDWRRHPDYEDLLQDAFVRAWEAMKRIRQQGRDYAVTTIAAHAADWALSDLKRRHLEPRPLSLDEIQERYGLDYDRTLPRTGDFTEKLLDRLHTRAQVEEFLRFCTPSERKLIQECCLEQRGLGGAAAERGVGKNYFAYRLDRLLKAYREAKGLPPVRRPAVNWSGVSRPRKPAPTHCRAGHAMTPDNRTRANGKYGWIGCLQCNRAYKREWKRRKKEDACISP